MHEPNEESMRNYAKTKRRPNDFVFFDGTNVPPEVQARPKDWSTFLPVEGFHTIGKTIPHDQVDTP
jgi:hypothetical protein